MYIHQIKLEYNGQSGICKIGNIGQQLKGRQQVEMPEVLRYRLKGT
jgi:hypothetical protein